MRSDEQQLRAGRFWWAWLYFVAALTGLIGLVMLIDGPDPVIIAWVLYFAGLAAIMLEPRYGLYLTVFLTLAGDNNLMPWYPFSKNFSSPESLFYVQGQRLIFSPLETYLVLTVVSWLIQAGLRRQLNFRRGPLSAAAALFTAFTLFGLAWGLTHGGNTTIALWEIRPILYLPLILVLTGSLITTREQVNRLIWLAMIALFIVSVAGIWYNIVVLHGVTSRIDSLIEHGAAVRLNTLFVLALAVFVYRASPAKRLVLPLMVPIALYTYVVAQRRAAIVSLGLALVLILLILYVQNRRVFWRVAPLLVLLSLVYLAAFWNDQGVLGLPARSIRSSFFARSGVYQEDASNYYRVIENFNISYTIHRVPLTGVGFGQQFDIIAPLPDISFFEWWQYIPHNSIVWIWVETGIGGFLSMLFLVSLSIMNGVRVVRRMPGDDLSAVALTAVLYIVMHFLYAYVDMAWDIRSMVYMGLMMGLINSFPWITAAWRGPVAVAPGGFGGASSGPEKT